MSRHRRHGPSRSRFEVSVAVPAVVAMPWKRSVEVKRILADFRVNLTVSTEDYNEAVEAGAIFDEVNGVLFVSPRMDLLPVSKWLPFSLDGRMHSVLKVSDDYGILAFNPSIPRAAGPTKMDGSPDMSHSEIIQVAEMLKSETDSSIPEAPVGGDTCPASCCAETDDTARLDKHSSAHRHSSRRRPSLSPEPSVPESIFIATQMRAIAAPFATKLAWILAVLVLALLHETVESVFTIGYSLLANAVFHWFQIKIGSHEGWTIAMSLVLKWLPHRRTCSTMLWREMRWP